MRTVNDIVPPSRRKDEAGHSSSRGPLRIKDKPPRFPYATIGTALIVILAAVGALFYFSSAKVEVTPNTVSAAVQGSFTASPNSGDLPYQVITAQKVASQAVKSSGTKTVSMSASGTITIYNTQTKPQTLIANTRFATAAGLIFRIHAGVTVPAASGTKPGSISAKVYADKPGPAYNVEPTSFTVPGFAGTPLATKVYAKSTTAMTGGYSGAQPVIDPATEVQARAALKNALAPDLMASLKGQVPDGYVLLPGAATTTYEELASDTATTGQVEVKEQGTATAIVFPNALIAKAIAGSVAGFGYQNEPMTLTGTDQLTLVPTSAFPTADSQSFSFTLAGTAPLMYTVDPTRIAAAVSGKTRQAAEVALTNYPEVKRAVIILRPFWRQTFPQDPASVSVVIDNPQ